MSDLNNTLLVIKLQHKENIDRTKQSLNTSEENTDAIKLDIKITPSRNKYTAN